MEAATIIIVVLAFAAAIGGVVAVSFAQIEAGWWGMLKSGALWAMYGLLAGVFNGPQIKSGEHPTLLTSLGQVLLLAVPLAVGAAIGGAVFAALYAALARGAWSGAAASPVLRVAAALTGGAVLGAVGGLLFVQVLAGLAALVGVTFNYKSEDNIVQVIAESAQGILNEGGTFAIAIGAIWGAIVGMVIGILNRN